MRISQNRNKSGQDIAEVLSSNMYHHLFPKHLELVPQLSEVYELQLAFYESQLLNDEEIIRNGAYLPVLIISLPVIF